MIFASVQFAKMFYSLCIKPILLPSCIDSDCGNPPPPSQTDRPIASIAFHAEGELLAVASGHKVVFLVFKLLK